MSEMRIIPVTARVPGGRRRHRKPKPVSAATRGALALAVAAPVVGSVVAAPSAFAAAAPTSAKDAGGGPDATDQKMAANLNTRINDRRLGTDVSGVVLDAASDKVVWGHDASTALMPASNAKLLTATAALTVLGPDHRFTTKVVYGNGTLTLVGGGDRVLTSNDLAALAKTAVAGLHAAGVRTVKVRVDDSLFPAPTLANGWNDSYYLDTITPVRALVVDGHNVMDTSIDAGKVFAGQLAADGVTVDGQVARGQASLADVPVARHQSPQLSAIVHKMLKVSDANIAETLLRMTALGAGRQATFEDGTAVVRQVLSQRYGIPLDNVELYDGSGVSHADRIPAATLADVLELLEEPRYQHTLGPILSGLPVAGEPGGTLDTALGRFDDAHSRCAVGKVQAKTGTLTGAIALSGVTMGKDGRWKVFSFLENGSTANTMDIRHAMDGLAATVNGCWA